MEFADALAAIAGISSFGAMLGSLLFKWIATNKASAARGGAGHALQIDIGGQVIEIHVSEHNAAQTRVVLDEAIQSVREHAA